MPSSASRSRGLEVALKIVAVAAGGLLLVLLYFFATGLSRRSSIDPAVFGLAPGEKAPIIAASAWMNGQPHDLGDKPMVVQAWFYNCPYCWQEAPEIVALSREYGDRVDFVALSPDPVSDKELVTEFVEANNIEYPVGYGATKTLAQFNVRAFPAVWLVAADGTVLWNRAMHNEQTLEEAIEASIADAA